MKILIIDDSLMVRNSIKRMIKKAVSAEVSLLDASDGKTGLSLVLNEKPDMVTLDLLMPIMDGTELMKNLQEMQVDCFKVVISSNIQKPVKERLMSLGADIFIEKPVTPDKIETIIAAYQAGRGEV